MRIRRMLSLFWATSILAGLFLLYVLTNLSYHLPSIRPGPVESKWSSLESKLRHVEQEVKQHRDLVGQIRASVNVMLNAHAKPPPPIFPPKLAYQTEEIIEKVEKVVGDEPPRMPEVKFLEPVCPIQRDTVPKTDIQMSSMYDNIMFDDKDGGAWKQGFKLEYKNSQWNKKNKLKVFIVPHSHNDPGWLKTFENYYSTQTRAILEHMVEKLFEVEGRKFIWAEVSFLQMWWSEADLQKRQALKKLLEKGNLEIVTGGWVMNDEANSHWLAIAQQLTLGHQWLFSNLGYRPKNSWSIDPFGHSSSQPYLLNLAGFENSVIQRVHYRVKKELAMNRQLEFKWRQLWDGVGTTDMRTHMMPFYSYDVPHSCGPDPKICCQFDFRRLPGNGMVCPWGISPKLIIPNNIDMRASVILDQWRKKAQLYKSNAVLVPLGDDFRYDREIEWDQQYKNYEALIGYINMKEDWNAEVQFGTLADYFAALHAEIRDSDVPVLSGDFFTYADRNQHYWSGYYTSRPFYKNMDRVLLAYLRAAEIITSHAIAFRAVNHVVAVSLRDRVDAARKALSLFQHHDGITGTSRDEVKLDYGKKLLAAIKHSQSAIQHAAYHLLKEPEIFIQLEADQFFDVDDIWRSAEALPTRITLTLDEMMPFKNVIVYNALMFTRHDIVTVYVNNPHVKVMDAAGEPVFCQVSPTVSGESNLLIASNLYRLSFAVLVEPLALMAYKVSLRDIADAPHYEHTFYAKVRVYNADYWTLDLPVMFEVEQSGQTLNEDITVQSGNGTRIVTNMNGLIKTIVKRDGSVVPAHMDFIFYGSQRQSDNNSGAYLFLPDGPAQTLKPQAYPEIVVMEGPLIANLYVALNGGPKAGNIVMSLTVHNNPKFPVDEVEISNTLLIDPLVDDIELAMRFSTSIDNKDVFYTDVNGMQMIKRRYYDKLPLQANFYPMPAAAYIQDKHTRLTLLTSTPLGMAALSPGQIEIMQDRKLSRDDNRGLNQGIFDNIRTQHMFKLIVESAKPCEQSTPAEHPSGWLSVAAHVSQQTLLQPLIKMYYTPRRDTKPIVFIPTGITRGYVDVLMASYKSHVSGKTKEGKSMQGAGLTFHRVLLDTCYGNNIAPFFPVGNGRVFVTELTNALSHQIYESSLTYTQINDLMPNEGYLVLCPMEVKSVFINTSAKRERHVVHN